MKTDKKNNTQVNLQIDVPSRGPSPIPQQIIKGHEVVLNLPKPLTLEEKKYLLSVERGDLANVRRYMHNSLSYPVIKFFVALKKLENNWILCVIVLVRIIH